MKYCSRCWMPDTKPYIAFDEEGVCNACQAHEQKRQKLGGIDWSQRFRSFEQIMEDTKRRQAPLYDVLVPVSGGKDSITQVDRLLKYDMRILAVNVDYGIKTEVGLHNLNLIPAMGAALMIYRPPLPLHCRLIRLGFEEYGDPDILSHTLLHGYPQRVALGFHIPLVWLGENSAFEYGGDSDTADRNTMTRSWFSKYAANAGRDARFFSEKHSIPMTQLLPYDFPDEIESSATTRSLFMSYFFFWDSEEHLRIALRHGFRTLDQPSEGTYRNYVGIDEKINRIHQYFKVLKFGYGRATDHACEDIRNGRLSRDQARELIRQHDLLPLSDYYVKDFIDFIGMTRTEFDAVIDRYRNPAIWKRDVKGRWHIPGHLEDVS